MWKKSFFNVNITKIWFPNGFLHRDIFTLKIKIRSSTLLLNKSFFYSPCVLVVWICFYLKLVCYLDVREMEWYTACCIILAPGFSTTDELHIQEFNLIFWIGISQMATISQLVYLKSNLYDCSRLRDHTNKNHILWFYNTVQKCDNIIDCYWCNGWFCSKQLSWQQLHNYWYWY